jgi:hypothetical protein
VRTNPHWLSVCDIKHPRTGLEVKFSYAYLAGMVLHGIDTASDRAFSNALGTDPALAAIAALVTVTGDAELSDTATILTVTLASGERVEVMHDLAERAPQAQTEDGLRSKATALLGKTVAERLWSAVTVLERLTARELAGRLTDGAGTLS